jgi:hypothetical protein
MRQFLYLIFFFSLSLNGYCQLDTVRNVADTSFNTSANVNQVDTISRKISDTISISGTNSEQLQVQVILVKEESSPDNFKYVFPILTLLLGILINKALDYFKDRKRIKKSGERWVAEIRGLELPIKSQLISLQMLKTEIVKEKFEVPEMEIYPMLNGEIFQSLDKADLIKYIVSFNGIAYENAVLASNRVHGYVNIMASHHDALKDKFEDFLKNTSAHTTTFNRHLQSLMRAFRNYVIALEDELQQDPINDPRYQPIFQLCNQHIIPFLTSGEYDVYALERDFFIPLIQILDNFRLDQKINEMSDAVLLCLAEIKGIKMEKGYLNENVNTLINRFENDLKELPEIVREIKK